MVWLSAVWQFIARLIGASGMMSSRWQAESIPYWPWPWTENCESTLSLKVSKLRPGFKSAVCYPICCRAFLLFIWMKENANSSWISVPSFALPNFCSNALMRVSAGTNVVSVMLLARFSCVNRSVESSTGSDRIQSVHESSRRYYHLKLCSGQRLPLRWELGVFYRNREASPQHSCWADDLSMRVTLWVSLWVRFDWLLFEHQGWASKIGVKLCLFGWELILSNCNGSSLTSVDTCWVLGRPSATTQLFSTI